MQIQRLEQTVGHRLLERSGRSVVPTKKGDVLLCYARQIMKLQSDAMSQLASIPLSGKVRFGTPDDYAYRILPRILSFIATEYPQIEVEVQCETSSRLVRLLEDGDVDFALITRTSGRPMGDLLRKEPVVWATAPTLETKFIEQIPLAVFQADCLMRQIVTTALEQAGRKYRIAYSSPHLSALLAVAGAGLAVAALPESSVPANLKVLGYAQGFPKLPTLELGIVMAPSNQNPLVNAMAAAARAALPISGPIGN